MSGSEARSGQTRTGVVVVTLVLLIVAAAVLPSIFNKNRWRLPGEEDSAIEIRPARKHSQVPGDGLIPRAPNPWFFLERAYPFGRIDRKDWERAQLEARTLREEKAVKSGSWSPLGPTNIGGRVTDIAVDPTDDAIVYAGAAEGGVLRSFDGGSTWAEVFDYEVTLSIGALAIDPVNPLVVYAGTGEVNPGGGSVAYGGAGVFRSTDRGGTWESIGLENTGSIGRITIDPTDPDRILVAAMGHLWEASSERGVYRTTDGGDSWERVLFVSDSTGCVDLIMRPDDPDVLLAAMWERIRRPEYYRYGGATCAVYKTIDGGDSWNPVGGGLPSPSGDLGRIGLSLCASQPDVMHAIYADRTGYFYALYRSTNGGSTWTQTNDASLSGVFASYGWWFGNVRTHPVDPDMVYVLGLDFYRSTDGGSSYSDASGGMHVDHHGLGFGSGVNPVIYNGNDGGVYRSTNGGSVWAKLYDLPITQIYRVALDASNPDALYGGSQDNSTVRTLSGATNDWTWILGGDGFQPLIHPGDSDRIWAQYQYGNVYYSNDGGSGWAYAMDGISGSDRNNWNSPLLQDPTDPSRRYFGTNKLYRSVTNTSWAAISADLTGGPHDDNPGQVRGTLTTIAVSPADADVIWTGSDDGFVHVTTNGGAGWTDVSAGLPDRWVTSVRTDPLSRETAYVTISGFRWAEPLAHVFRTADLGSTWVSISGNLPEAPANDLVVDPAYSGRYFVATDVGVYQTTDGGSTWSMLGADLPNVVVNSLVFKEVDRTLIAGTYGRSFFGYSVGDVSAVDGPVADVPRVIGRTLAPQPNPATESTWIAWETRGGVPVSVDVYTVSGRHVWSKMVVTSPAGEGRAKWDGKDSRGRDLPSGTYFMRVRTRDTVVGNETVVIIR
ncbi:MAG: glycosyl hydrolase [Candidatus Eisenbacteria bacterium]